MMSDPLYTDPGAEGRRRGAVAGARVHEHGLEVRVLVTGMRGQVRGGEELAGPVGAGSVGDLDRPAGLGDSGNLAAAGEDAVSRFSRLIRFALGVHRA